MGRQENFRRLLICPGLLGQVDLSQAQKRQSRSFPLPGRGDTGEGPGRQCTLWQRVSHHGDPVHTEEQDGNWKGLALLALCSTVTLRKVGV